MRKSESLERLSIVLIGMSIGILLGSLATKYLPIFIVGFAPIVILSIALLIREISERIEKQEMGIIGCDNESRE